MVELNLGVSNFLSKRIADLTQEVNFLSLKRIYTVFVICPFLKFLLLEKVCVFFPHFYKSISVLRKLLHIDKNFVPKAMFQN